MVCGILNSRYYNRAVIGYFHDRESADKYCAAYGNGEYLIEPFEDLSNTVDLSHVSLLYENCVWFDWDQHKWLMNPKTHYNCYTGSELRVDRVEMSMGYNKWIKFYINTDQNDRLIVEDRAYDYFRRLVEINHGVNISKESVQIMNNQFAEPFKIKEQQEKERQLRIKELAELKRLKEKYE